MVQHFSSKLHSKKVLNVLFLVHPERFGLSSLLVTKTADNKTNPGYEMIQMPYNNKFQIKSHHQTTHKRLHQVYQQIENHLNMYH